MSRLKMTNKRAPETLESLQRIQNIAEHRLSVIEAFQGIADEMISNEEDKLSRSAIAEVANMLSARASDVSAHLESIERRIEDKQHDLNLDFSRSSM